MQSHPHNLGFGTTPQYLCISPVVSSILIAKRI